MGGSAEPRVAVIVPCFNDGATLPEALASLDAQEQCEVVVINDGSDDTHTRDVLEDVRASGVRVIDQQNRGLARARMAGVAATSARFIYPLDADDGVAPGAIERLADALDADPGAGLAWGDQQLMGQIDLLAPRARSLDPWAITHVNMLPVSALIRRGALLAAGGWVLHGGYEDWDLWMTLAERGCRGVYVPGPAQLYRIADGRMLADTFRRHDEQFALCRHRHPGLFAAQRDNWRRSEAPLAQRLLLPVAARLPLVSPRTRHRIALFVSQPAHGIRSRWRRRVAPRR